MREFKQDQNVTAKLHIRRLSNGGFFVHGYIPPEHAKPLEALGNDSLAAASVFLALVEDRTEDYKGVSSAEISRRGFP